MATPRPARPKPGPLKLVTTTGGALKSVGPEGSAALAVPARAPDKPKAVAESASLSQWWDDIVPGIDAAGLLSTMDTAALVSMIQHLDVSHRAYKDVVAEGLSIPNGDPDLDSTTYKKNPSEAILRMESAAVLEYAKQLGMTWMARARTNVPKGDASDGSPFADTASG